MSFSNFEIKLRKPIAICFLIYKTMQLLSAFARLALNQTARRCICTTPALYAEPLKKKKKLDPAIIKQREDRRRKKLEKQIRRLEKNARQLKPVDELEVPLELLDEKQMRARTVTPLSDAEIDRRTKLMKAWTKYKHDQKVADFQIIDSLVASQLKALEQLRIESEELYQAAIETDATILPITLKGPVATPPIKDYKSPDGEYILKAKSWEVK